MPRNPNSVQFNIQLSRSQHEALQDAASLAGMDMSQFVRHILGQRVPGFDPDAIPERGTYDRRRRFVGLCISDDDVVTLDTTGLHAEAWKDGWHRNTAGEEIPAVYHLAVGDDEPRQFETMKDLLDAMAALASFDAWRVEGEEKENG